MSRPVFLTAACSLALLVPVPAGALASGGGSSSAHAKSKAHHKSARHRRAAAAVDNSGSVMSFDGTILTVKRADGSTMSGRVDDATRMSCETEQQFEAEHTAATAHRRRGATAKAARNGESQSSSAEPNHPENEAENEPTGDGASDDQAAASCGMADMTPGAKVNAKLAAGSKSLIAEVRLVK
jgi:hypothetical protein